MLPACLDGLHRKKPHAYLSPCFIRLCKSRGWTCHRRRPSAMWQTWYTRALCEGISHMKSRWWWWRTRTLSLDLRTDHHHITRCTSSIAVAVYPIIHIRCAVCCSCTASDSCVKLLGSGQSSHCRDPQGAHSRWQEKPLSDLQTIPRSRFRSLQCHRLHDTPLHLSATGPALSIQAVF